MEIWTTFLPEPVTKKPFFILRQGRGDHAGSKAGQLPGIFFEWLGHWRVITGADLVDQLLKGSQTRLKSVARGAFGLVSTW